MMEEPNRNSMKLDIEAVRLSDSDRDHPKETYKPIPEYLAFDGAAVKNSNMVREKGDNIEDGAAETMLGGHEKEQLAQKDEVKFISGDHKNGDAKIDIGGLEKSFTGMTKEELMRYANDPFWVRLRWIFFVLFWALWIAMLVGAILIIIGAPKCAAPSPLAWYKQGPLVVIPKNEYSPDEVKGIQNVGAKGVIYALPEDETYLVNTADVETRIKRLVDSFKDINVILDITPNFVSKDDELFKKAIEDDAYRGAFVFAEREVTPTNWLSKVNGSAWEQYAPKHFVLSQFGENRYDLQLNNTFAKDKFKAVLQSLIKLGVKGFRLVNAKHLIINKELKDEVQASIRNAVHTDYDYWTHTQTTFQAGLGDLLAEFANVIKNATNGEGFLSVTDNIVRPEVFTTQHGELGIELPVYGLLPHTLAASSPSTAKQLYNELTQIVGAIGKQAWIQWQYDQRALETGNVGLSEYNTFIMLLPGVAVATTDAFLDKDNSTTYIKDLEGLRESPSYMHGSFDVYTDPNETVIAYTRIKSGNPGYFVAYNPNEAGISSDFSKVKGMPEQLTVHMYSKNYNLEKIVEKVKVQSTEIPIAGRSVIILTYVPKSIE